MADLPIDLDELGMASGYQALVERCLIVLSASPHVQALLVLGSAGRGEADTASDLDLLVAAFDQEAARVLLETRQEWLPQITDTIYLRVLGGVVLTMVTPDWKRLDIMVIDQAKTTIMTSGPGIPVFQKLDTEPPGQPTFGTIGVERVVESAENFLRSIGLMAFDLERQELTTLTWASEFLIQELAELLFVDAGIPRRTTKRIRSDLPISSALQLDGIPRATAAPDSIVRSHLATAALYLPLARRLIETNDGAWPLQLEESTRTLIRQHLRVELPSSVWAS